MQRVPVPGPPIPIEKLVPVPVVVVKEVEVTKLVSAGYCKGTVDCIVYHKCTVSISLLIRYRSSPLRLDLRYDFLSFKQN